MLLLLFVFGVDVGGENGAHVLVCVCCCWICCCLCSMLVLFVFIADVGGCDGGVGVVYVVVVAGLVDASRLLLFVCVVDVVGGGGVDVVNCARSCCWICRCFCSLCLVFAPVVDVGDGGGG